MENTIQKLIASFVSQLATAIEADIARRVQQVMSSAFAGGTVAKRGPGRPPRNAMLQMTGLSLAPVKRRPRQLCPVPGCKGVAAPVFGMVCVEHKDLPKNQIKKFRADRREARKNEGKKSEKQTG